MISIAVVNMKGGVGKTLVAGSLARELGQSGHRVLAIDSDPQASLTLLLRRTSIDEISGCAERSGDRRWVEALCRRKSVYPHIVSANKGGCPEGVRLLQGGVALSELNSSLQIQAANAAAWPALLPQIQAYAKESLPLHVCNAIERAMRSLYPPLSEHEGISLAQVLDDPLVRNHFDFTIIDTPPLISSILVDVLFSADRLLIVATPDTHSRSSIDLLLNEIDRIDRESGGGCPSDKILGIVLNRVSKTRAARQEAEEIRRLGGDLVFDCEIPADSSIERASTGKVTGLLGNYFSTRGRGKAPPAQAALARLSQELLARLHTQG